MKVVEAIEPEEERRDVEIPRAESDGVEQALARLIRLGVVIDYSIPRERAFDVVVAPIQSDTVVKSLAAYVERSQPGRSKMLMEQLGDQSGFTTREVIENCGRALIGFVYETIERSRRRSIREMWLAAREASGVPDDVAAEHLLRRRILDYLTEGDISPILEKLANGSESDLEKWYDLLGKLFDDATAQEIRGAVARLLTSDPTHTGLLLARACSEALASDRDLEDVVGNLDSMFSGAHDRFGLNTHELSDLAYWMVGWATDRDHDVLAAFEVAIARAKLADRVENHPALMAARSQDEPNPAIVINHWWSQVNNLFGWLDLDSADGH
jgi:ATP-dependent DNA helicase RecQ